MRPHAVWSLVLGCCLMGSSSLRAENWPGWRGPQRTGISGEKQVPTKWSANEGILWKAPLPGAGISHPIIWDQRVIATSSDGPSQSELHVSCLDRDSGKELWHTRLWGTAPTLFHATKSNMASPTPVTDGRHVYCFFGSGDLFCLDLDGKLVWQRSLADEYGEFENRFAATSSPLLYQGLVLLQCDHYGASYVLAVDQETGENRWKADRPEAWLSWSTPQLAPVGNDGTHELIVSGSEKLDAYNPLTGEKLWTLRGMRRECIPTPVLGHGLIYAVSGPKGPTVAIKPGGRGDVTESDQVVWKNVRGAPFVPSAILVGDYYYLVDDHGIATCLDAHTGKLVWQKRLNGDFTASPVAADGHLYLVDEEGRTLILRAGIPTYDEVGENSLGEPVYASPAISQGRLYLRTASHLYCIGQP